MERFGIFKQKTDGARAFITASADVSSATSEALTRSDTDESHYVVFDLRTMARVFDTEAYRRRARKRNEMKTRQPAPKTLR
jgi:hypothetical protein